jgi:hypothetical protein
MANNKEVESYSWFQEYDKKLSEEEAKDLPPIFKMKLGEGEIAKTEQVEFLSNGTKKDTDYGEAIIFQIKNDSIEKTWFIKKNQYTLLNAIARERKAGSIIGKTATVTRTGSGQKQTRWAIKF